MDRVFKYSILKVMPDWTRGEKVNVGVVVFLNGRLDFKFAETEKLKVLTGKDWSSYLNNAMRNIDSRYEEMGEDFFEEIQINPCVDPAIEFCKAGSFLSLDEMDYDSRVAEILQMYVLAPKVPNKRRSATRINTEITRFLKNKGLFNSSNEPLDTHKVFPNLLVEDGLNADFAQKNGVMRVVATLDLRRATSGLKEAALKAVTLDRARIRFEGSVCIGVYAAENPDDANVHVPLQLMQEYSEELFDWNSEKDQRRLSDFFFSGLENRNQLV